MWNFTFKPMETHYRVPNWRDLDIGETAVKSRYGGGGGGLNSIVTILNYIAERFVRNYR